MSNEGLQITDWNYNICIIWCSRSIKVAIKIGNTHGATTTTLSFNKTFVYNSSIRTGSCSGSQVVGTWMCPVHHKILHINTNQGFLLNYELCGSSLSNIAFCLWFLLSSVMSASSNFILWWHATWRLRVENVIKVCS